MTILDKLADHARERLEAKKAKLSLPDLKRRVLVMPRGNFLFETALRRPGLSFICECKKASPSKGLIAPEFPYLDIAKDYEAAGADAISVLTEPKWFLGADEYLEEIARAVSAERNALRIASYEGDPEGLAAMKARNLAVYGREEGPTPDEMYEKYGAWETVIEKAFSVNMGLDVCLGLYDEYYPIYLALGQIPDEETQVSTREFAVASFIRSSGMDMTSASHSVLARLSDADAITPWFRTEMATAVAGGIIKGYDTGVLCPGEGIRRIEAFVILSRCLPDLQADREAIPFTDVPAWAKADLDRLSGAGLVLGYGNNTLGADDQLTVEQVGILAARLQLMLDL